MKYFSLSSFFSLTFSASVLLKSVKLCPGELKTTQTIILSLNLPAFKEIRGKQYFQFGTLLFRSIILTWYSRSINVLYCVGPCSTAPSVHSLHKWQVANHAEQRLLATFLCIPPFTSSDSTAAQTAVLSNAALSVQLWFTTRMSYLGFSFDYY